MSLLADLDLDVGLGAGQRLGVGVDRDELHALEVLLDHAVDGVAAAAADADTFIRAFCAAGLFELEDHGVSSRPVAQKKSCSHRLTGVTTLLHCAVTGASPVPKPHPARTCRAP